MTTIDYTQKYWGHNMSIKQDADGILRGFIWVTPPAFVNDLLVWETEYGTATGRVIECTWVGNVDDMYQVAIEVVKRTVQ